MADYFRIFFNIYAPQGLLTFSGAENFSPKLLKTSKTLCAISREDWWFWAVTNLPSTTALAFLNTEKNENTSEKERGVGWIRKIEVISKRKKRKWNKMEMKGICPRARMLIRKYRHTYMRLYVKTALPPAQTNVLQLTVYYDQPKHIEQEEVCPGWPYTTVSTSLTLAGRGHTQRRTRPSDPPSAP